MLPRVRALGVLRKSRVEASARVLVVVLKRPARVESAVLAMRAVWLVLRGVPVFGGVYAGGPVVIDGSVAVGHLCDRRLVGASRVVEHVAIGSRVALHCGVQKRRISVSSRGATHT